MDTDLKRASFYFVIFLVNSFWGTYIELWKDFKNCIGVQFLTVFW